MEKLVELSGLSGKINPIDNSGVVLRVEKSLQSLQLRNMSYNKYIKAENTKVVR